MQNTTYALQHDWLDGAANTAAVGAVTLTTDYTGTVTTGCSNTLACYPGTLPYYPYPYYVYPIAYNTYTVPARPIKLTLAEVDRLRKAAKADEKLKAVLAKFTDQIEIVMSLD